MSEKKQLKEEELVNVSGGETVYFPKFTFVLTFKYPTGDQDTYEINVNSINEQSARSKALSEAIEFCKMQGFQYVSLTKKS